jgi:hypothetical protein
LEGLVDLLRIHRCSPDIGRFPGTNLANRLIPLYECLTIRSEFAAIGNLEFADGHVANSKERGRLDIGLA